MGLLGLPGSVHRHKKAEWQLQEALPTYADGDGTLSQVAQRDSRCPIAGDDPYQV